MHRFSLDDILESDPLELLSDLKVKNPIITADDRLLASFEEINEFYEKNLEEPKKSSDMNERRLFSRLQGLKDNPLKREALKQVDRFNLLESEEAFSLEDIFDNDPLGLLYSKDENIFDLKHIPKITTMPDYVSSRKTCEKFEKYEHLFLRCQNDLKTSKRILIKFQNEQQIKKGYYFVLNGLLLYVLDVGEFFIKEKKKNARLRLIFENGTESDMLLRSLSAELYKNGKRVSEYDEGTIEGLYKIDKEDDKKGYLYILKSLSSDDRIMTKKDLYKIGFSRTKVETRIQNAKQDPTYLMAEVQILSVFEVYNANPHKLEQLIHKFFSHACLDIDIIDARGKIQRPREWFSVPLDLIEEAISLIISGNILEYTYDSENELIIKREIK